MTRATITDAVKLAHDLQELVDATVKPPSETAPSAAEPVVYMALVRGTRGYLEKLAHQINGTYANGWYDACCVMIRRLIETLIIEAFEAHKIQAKIKDGNGDYLYLGDLIDFAIAETTWSLSRSGKKALPRLKDVGDKSAHSRWFNAHRQDIDKTMDDLRVVVQELLGIARLK